MTIKWKTVGVPDEYGRIFPLQVLRRVTKELNEMAKSNKLFGTNFSKYNGSFIDLNKVCIKVNDVFMKDGDVYVTYEFTDNNYAKRVLNFIESTKLPYTLTARMMGSEKNNVVQDDLIVCGFDVKIIPQHENVDDYLEALSEGMNCVMAEQDRKYDRGKYD